MNGSGKKNRIPKNVLALARKASAQVPVAASGPGNRPAASSQESPARKKIVAALKKLHPMD